MPVRVCIVHTVTKAKVKEKGRFPFCIRGNQIIYLYMHTPRLIHVFLSRVTIELWTGEHYRYGDVRSGGALGVHAVPLL